MNVYLKIALISAAIYIGCLFLTFVVILVTAGVTSKVSAGEMGPVLMFLLVTAVAIFGVGTFLVQRASASILAGQASPGIVTVLFGVGGVVTLVVVGFLALIVFNR